jgi:hypothetical protein
MNAKELADKFNAKTGAAVAERERQSGLATEHIQKRGEDIEHCKRAMERDVLPFMEELKQHLVMEELKQHLGDGQFTFAPQIDRQDHKPVGVSGPARALSFQAKHQVLAGDALRFYGND